MRIAVFAAALLAALAWAQPAFAADAADADAPDASAVQPAAASPDAQELARWFYAVVTGEIAARTGHPGIAYTELLEAARDMNSARLFERATEVALEAQAPEDALAAVNAWRGAQPDSVRAQEIDAQLLLALGRNGEAAGAVARLLTLEPAAQRGGTIMGLLGFFGRSGDAQAELDLARKTLAPYAKLPETNVVLSQLQTRAGDSAGALDSAAAALQAEPGMSAAALLVLLDYKVDPERADQLLGPYFALNPDDTNSRLAWIQAALEQERDGIALQQADALSRNKPDLADAWLVLGAVRLQDGQIAGAKSALLSYLGLLAKAAPGTAPNPAGQARACLGLADIASQQGDQTQALHWLAQVPPGQEAVAVAVQRATVLARQGHMQAALDLLGRLPGKTLAQQRERTLAHAGLLDTMKQHAVAYRVLQAGMARFGHDPDYAYQTAMMAQKSGHADQMVQLLRDIIAADTRYQSAYNALGYTLADAGRQLPEAYKLVAHALKLAPGDPFVLDSMGWVQYRMGDLAKAAATLEQAYAARPDAEIGAHLAEVLWQQGERARAQAVLREAWELAPQDDVVRATMQRLGLQF